MKNPALWKQRGQAHTLKPDEVQGATFTLTNHGTGGSLVSTFIISQPQDGILGTGVVNKRAVVVGDDIAVRPMVYRSFTFDHRILDHAATDGFLVTVSNIHRNGKERDYLP